MAQRDRVTRLERERETGSMIRRETDGQGWTHIIRTDRAGAEVVRVSLPPNGRDTTRPE